MTRNRVVRAVAVVAVVAVAAGMMLAGCSSSSSTTTTTTKPAATSADKVCKSKTHLDNEVAKLTSDVKAGNFGQAKDDLAGIKTALQKLVKHVDDLKAEQKQALSPKVDQLKSTISGLTNPSSLSDLKTGIESVGTQLQALNSEVSSTVSCS
jgi:uncharacterized phage infection (PIP) family protein YhgE